MPVPRGRARLKPSIQIEVMSGSCIGGGGATDSAHAARRTIKPNDVVEKPMSAICR
jgi:hypothetical protein